MLTAGAPAKLILSGEHAVVYGQPALAMAVNQYAFTSIKSAATEYLQFNLVNLQRKITRSLPELTAFKNKIALTKTLTDPSELLQYAFIYFLEHLAIKLTSGLVIEINSTIPVGCGMGSSAATLVSLLHAMIKFFAVTLPLSAYITLARTVENLQHGVSSGLDIFLATHGGCYLREQDKFTPQPLPQIPLVLVNSGKPQTTTGECVQAAAPFFRHTTLGDTFAEVTQVMQLALKDNNVLAVQQCVRENHRLLQYIGVVPKKVSEFIAQVEALGGAAKISGAGAIAGDNAGVILVVGNVDLAALTTQFGFTMFPVRGEAHGVRIV